jgi:hypothetical protein
MQKVNAIRDLRPAPQSPPSLAPPLTRPRPQAAPRKLEDEQRTRAPDPRARPLPLPGSVRPRRTPSAQGVTR